MTKRFRCLTAALCATLMLSLSAAPAASYEIESSESQKTPAAFDVFVMRPFGLLAMLAGTLLFLVPVAPLTLLTRPSEIGKPFEALVARPTRFTMVDPIGSH